MRHTNLTTRAPKYTPARKLPNTRLGLERLEQREVPAAITASLNGGVLKIVGTDQKDTIRVDQVSGQISVQGVQISKGGSSVSKVASSEVTKILAYGNGSDDLIDLRNTFSSLKARVEVYGGSGNDTIHAQVGRDRVVGGTGSDTINATLNFDSLEAAKSGRLFFDDSFKSGDGTDRVNVSLNLSSFGGRLLKPALRELSAATSALDPVVKLMNKKVPGLSVLDKSMTYKKIASMASSRVGKFLDTVSAVRNLSNSVSLNGTVDLGSFSVTAGSTPSVSTISANPLAKINSSALKAARNAGVKFGLLESPKSAIDMMLGKNVELVSMKLELPRVSKVYAKTYESPTGVPGLNVKIDFSAEAWVSAKATFGMDMKGVWSGRVLDGFFITDASAAVGAKAEVRGGVSLGVPRLFSVGSVQGYGNVSGTVNFALAGGSKRYLADLPKFYSDSLKTTGSIGYDIGYQVKYTQLKTSYKFGIPYPEWVGRTHRVSLGKGSINV